ncbi:hypothetical protein BH10PSE18_BH10PSE18_26590 [soil metagenome]
MSNARPHATSLELARETRERFLSTTSGVILPLSRAVGERLAAQAGLAGTARDMQERRDDFLAFHERASSWVALTQAGWRQARPMRDERRADIPPQPSSARSPLALIGDEVVETNILSLRLAEAIRSKAGFDFNDLRLRVQHLEGRTELATHDVLRPETLAGLLVAQWLASGLERAVWARVQDAIQQEVVDTFVAAYKSANAFLVDNGVMPEIDLKNLVRRPTHPAHSGATPLGGGVQTAAPVAAQAGGWRHSINAILGSVERRVGAGSPLMLARQRAQTVLASLKRFVATRVGSDFARPPTEEGGVANQAVHSRAFSDALSNAEAGYRRMALQYPANGDATIVMQHSAADLRRRTTDLKRRAPTTADKATVEIVALMFQSILAEERIPFSARVWFARLQMPVLRVAIAEPEFFGTLQHPARMLIDRMGSVVMGFDAAAISGSALEGEIRRVVQVIEQYPETGQRVFKLVLDEFGVFLNKYLTQGDATQRVMSVAQQVEQKETMAIQYTIELRKLLDDMPVREEIREFLFKVWAEVLAIAALKFGPQDEQTVMLKRAASELVWSASAKPNRTDRARVIQELPRLLQRLRSGMTLLGMTGAPQEAHIKAIGETLADAFLSKTEAIPQAKIEAMALRLANLDDFVSVGGNATVPLDTASIELLLGADAAALEVIPDTGQPVSEEMRAWVEELQVGHWFMLDHNGRAAQVQFVWRSERGQLHLFASNDGRGFLIQAGRLAFYLQAGLLIPAEDESLTARATREALAKLDANPERLLD